MSVVIVLTPIIISSWPVISAAAVGAASALGLIIKDSAIQAAKQMSRSWQSADNSIEIELEDSNVLTQGIATDRKIVLTKGDIELTLRRDERGRCCICAKGAGHSKVELKQIAEQFMQKLTQCFVYNNVMKELKSKNFQVINEEVREDEEIRIHVRRWME